MEMKTIDAKQCTTIALGRLGENNYTVVRFDVSAWLGEVPGAVIGLYNQRPGDADAYPIAAIAVEDGIATWTVTSAELTKTGEGRCELVAIAGEVVAKSVIFRTMVFDALNGSGEVPEPWEEWQQQFIILKGEAEQAADRAEEAVEHYPRIVEGVWEVWDAQAGVYVSTGVQAIGVDGISPTITVAPITGGHRITITDANGTHTVDVLDGENGDAGRGIVSVQKTGTAGLVDTYTITYTDSTTSTFTVTNGQNGNDGISPSITVTDITGGHRVTITDATGAHTFDVMDGTGSVQDVQVDGASVVTSGVATIPKGSNSVFGVIRTHTNTFTYDTDGRLCITAAGFSHIKEGTNSWRPIMPNGESAAAFYGLAKAAGDTTQSASSNAVGTYTENAKKAIQHMIGVPETWEFINTVEISEDANRILCNTDSSGQPFTLKAALMIIYSEVSEQVTDNVNIKCGFSPLANNSSTNYDLVQITAGIRTTAQQNVAWAKVEGIIPDTRSSTPTIAGGHTTLFSAGAFNVSETKKLAISVQPNLDTDGFIHCVYVEGKYFGPGSFIRVWGIRA